MTSLIAEYFQALWAIVLELSPPLPGGLIFAGHYFDHSSGTGHLLVILLPASAKTNQTTTV